jgi:hypothetical protein
MYSADKTGKASASTVVTMWMCVSENNMVGSWDEWCVYFCYKVLECVDQDCGMLKFDACIQKEKKKGKQTRRSSKLSRDVCVSVVRAFFSPRKIQVRGTDDVGLIQHEPLKNTKHPVKSQDDETQTEKHSRLEATVRK